IIDNTGFKMARDGKIAVWEGIWLSSAILLPLGIFFTYKAMKDSAVFDLDAIKNRFRRLTGRMKRELDVKEFTMTEVDPEEALSLLRKLQQECLSLSEAYRTMAIWKRALYIFRRFPQRDQAQSSLNDAVDYLANSRDGKVIALLNMYPFQITTRTVGQTMEVNSGLLKLFERQTFGHKAS
ncbi:MAG: hypothetical protein K2K36_07180, partial [Muribaculaceae bacterium]|nr:hypothetical protein [Muribaculaceae bacterium]